MDETPEVRVLVLAAQGKHFCAGRNFANPETQRKREERPEGAGNELYAAAVRLFEAKKPVVAAIQGAAVGGGFGLAQKVREQTDKEWAEQRWLQSTDDHKEGIRAVAERRVGNFTGK